MVFWRTWSTCFRVVSPDFFEKGRTEKCEVLFEANGRVACLHLARTLFIASFFCLNLIYLTIYFGYLGYNMPYMLSLPLAKNTFCFSRVALYFPCFTHRRPEKYSNFANK